MDELSITELAIMLDNGEINSFTLVESYQNRIDNIDKQGPGLNSVIELNPEALEIASSLDKERLSNGARSLLHGIPIMLKDNFDTADRMSTTAGSLALQGNFSKQDSFVASQLRKAGAIILAKTNLSEWANFRSEHSTSGWSSRGGQTHNPYALDRNPCGSSSGSAVAVAANLCAGAIGTETDGSVVCPSHANGIVGIKPTVGLVSRAGIIPISHSQDTAGPMARSVQDAAILLGSLAGPDPRDPATMNGENQKIIDYTKYLDPDGFKDARIGVARNFFGFLPDVDGVIDSSIQVMRELGAVIIDEADIETKADYGEPEYEVLLYEFQHDINEYLSHLDPAAKVHNLKELIEFNQTHSTKMMPYFAQERFEKAQEKGSLEEKEYLDARRKCLKLTRDDGIDATINKHKLDAIIAPAGGPAWLTDYVNGDHYGGASSSPAAIAGYPNITVPAGYITGLPIGISFFSGAYKEPLLLKLAYAFEQATDVRQSPQYLPSVEL